MSQLRGSFVAIGHIHRVSRYSKQKRKKKAIFEFERKEPQLKVEVTRMSLKGLFG
jgi:hypothetical protein